MPEMRDLSQLPYTCDFRRFDRTTLYAIPCGYPAVWHVTGLGSRMHSYDRCSRHRADAIASVTLDGGEPKVEKL